MNNVFLTVQELCDKHNITIYALEKNTGINHGTIQKWKDAVPSCNNIIKVADYFNISLDFLFNRCNNPKSHLNYPTDIVTGINELINTFNDLSLIAAQTTERIESDVQRILKNYHINPNIEQDSD